MGNHIFWEEVEAQVDLKVGICMPGDYGLSELAEMLNENNAYMEDIEVRRVHHHAVILAHEFVLYNMAAFHMVAYCEYHPAGLRDIVLEQRGQSGAIQVSGFRIFPGRVLPDSRFEQNTKYALDGAANRKLHRLIG